VYTNFAAEQSPKKAVAGNTPQDKPIPGREAEMVVNNAGGFTFKLDQWGVLDRFLMIGSESGNYYVKRDDVMKQSFKTVLACLKSDAKRAIDRAVEYSVTGRAPKNDPSLVLLAVAASKGDRETQAMAYEALNQVARTGTHLFTFVSILNSMGKWNAAAKRGIAAWYKGRSADRLALQLLKYQSRNEWSHRDVLRLAHVKPEDDVQNNLFKYVVKGAESLEKGAPVPQLLVDFEYLKHATTAKEVVKLVEQNRNLTWEMVPTQFLKDTSVMMALLPSMGMTALIRQLGRLSAIGVFDPMSAGQKLAIAKLSNAEELKKQRLHPVTLLQALKQYGMGRGERGSGTWPVNQRIVDALNDAFYASFSNVEDTGMGIVMGIDTSGSMWWESSKVIGSPNLVAADVAACMAMAIVKNQSNYFVGTFDTTLKEIKISPSMRLDDVMRKLKSAYGGGTDCSAPMRYAQQHKMSGVDLFVTITDNETWAGRDGHASQHLNKYRNSFVPTAKAVVIGTSVSEFTIADPKDAGQMDIAGFDSAAPQIIADFATLGRR
jgi:60 kDa SS-A/Ro ribonucleoprotein